MRFALWDIIEQKFASEEFQERVRELEEKAKAVIDVESRESILERHTHVITGEAGQTLNEKSLRWESRAFEKLLQLYQAETGNCPGAA